VGRTFALLLGVLMMGLPNRAIAFGHVGDDQKAMERALMQGRIDEAVPELQAYLAANPTDGNAHLLLCRAFYSVEKLNEAMSACELAVQTLATNSDAQDWMGRVYGLKADRSGPLGGLRLARKVKSSFESAVDLDPANGAAVNDLSEYYVGAPGVVGGGLDKAEALAERVEMQLPQQAHRIRALAAEKNRDYDAAEREFKAAVAVANRPDAWADLGGYYGRRKQDDKAVEALRRCLAADRAHGPSTVDAASILMDIHREPQLAEQALRQYLAGHSKSDAAPVVHVEVLLASLRLAAGDKAGAKIELDKALQLASNYAPAKHAMLALEPQQK
jgi:tetratricopeptide (TPR) repeat protein